MFKSILFCGKYDQKLCDNEPSYFQDLNIDQLIKPILENEKNVDLSPYYYTTLKNEEDVMFRQGIYKDIAFNDTRMFDMFSADICALNECAQKAVEDLNSKDQWRCNYLLYGHILDYSEQYVKAVKSFKDEVSNMNINSEGIKDLVKGLNELCASTFFIEMEDFQKKLRADFSKEKYCMLIKNGTIRVKKYDDEENLSEKISNIFEKFKDEGGEGYVRSLKEEPRADHVEEGILKCLSSLYPEMFKNLKTYGDRFADFVNDELLNLCREIRFYLSWISVSDNIKKSGLPMCFPEFDDNDIYGNNVYDIVLAENIGDKIIKNDFCMRSPERIFVVTGPNQGGKTTFARAFGQMHYIASLGFNIPGTSAKLLLPDNIYTHFEREEILSNLNGKLEDDVERLYTLLKQATNRSLIIVNEIFASTVLEDAEKLGNHMMTHLVNLKAVCVIVTFLDVLADHGIETVSMVSELDKNDSGKRTFKMVRKSPVGFASAMTLAKKHGLTYEQIKRRIGV